MSRDICLIDANSIGNANHNIGKMTVGEQQTQAVYGTLRMCNRFLTEYPDFRKLWLWDCRANWRYQLYPDYKSSRIPKTPEQEEHKRQYKNQIPIIQECLKVLGIPQLQVAEYEADDLAGWLSRYFSDKDVCQVLITADMDWCQLVSDKTKFYDPIHDKKISLTNYEEMTGYENPDYFLEGKTLMGDNSDSLPPVGGIGKKTAPIFVKEFGGVEAFLNLVDSGHYKPRSKKEQNLAGDGREKYLLNKKMMDLRSVKMPIAENVVMKHRGDFNPERFRDICYDLNFNEFLKDWDNFIEPFRLASSLDIEERIETDGKE